MMTYSYNSWRSQFGQPNSMICMTPQVFLDSLRHAFVSLDEVDLIVFDECHNSKKNNPANLVMTEFYFPAKDAGNPVPKILGLTASPSTGLVKFEQQLQQLERDLDSVAFTSINGVDEVRQEIRAEILPYEESELVVPQKDRDTLEECKAKGERKVFTNAMRCLEELGEWGFHQVLLMRDEMKHPVPKKTFDEWRASGLLNDKVIKLILFLQEFPSKEDFHGIVFCQCKIVCQLLTELLQSITDLTWIRCTCVTGHGGKGVKGMSSATQMRAVEWFRDKTFNLAVATSVLEEGLDVGTCEVVVRFNPPPTLQSSIQSKGRARKGQSLYVVMSAIRETFGSETVSYRDKVKGLENERSIFEIQSRPALVKYVSEKTGAIATLASSISLVNRWCSSCHGQPVWTYENPKREPYGGVCTTMTCVLCPPAPRDPIVVTHGNYVKEKTIKKELALKCVQFLHEHHFLDDFLLPSGGRQGQIIWKSRDGDSICVGREPRMTTITQTRVPAAMKQPLVVGQDMCQTNLLVETGYNAPDGTSVLVKMPYTLVSSHPLVSEPFDISVPNTTFKGSIRIKRSEPAVYTSEQLDLARQCTKVLFESVIKNSTRDNISFDWSKTMRNVVVLPLLKDSSTPDWSVCRMIIERYDQLTNAEQGPAGLPNVFDPQDIIRFTHTLFFAIEVAPGVTMNTRTEHDPSKTYAEDNFEKHQIVLRDPAAPFLRCSILNKTREGENIGPKKRYCVPSEAATFWPLRVDMQSTMRILAENFWKIEHYLLVEELINSKQFPVLRPQIGKWSPSKQRQLLVEALTAAAVCHPMYGNYEKLEFLGDAVLKYGAVATIVMENQHAAIEQLVVKKNDVVSNEMLFRLSTEQQFPELLQTTSSPWTSGCFPGTSNENELPRLVSNKTIADCVESLTGACFALMLGDSDGPTLLQQCASPAEKQALWLQHHLAWANALHFLEECGHPLKQQLDIEAFARAHKHEMRYSALPEAELQEMQRVLCVPVTARGLLEAAFTDQHTSPQKNYEVLEFLGDAVLDGVVTQQLFQRFGSDARVRVGDLSQYRALVVENDTLAYLALCLGLDRCVRCTPNARAAIDQYRSSVLRAVPDLQTGRLLPQLPRRLFGSAPKILADVFEACVAVVFFECGGNIVKTADVVVPWVAPILDHVQDFGELSSVLLRRCLHEWKLPSMSPETTIRALPRSSPCAPVCVEARLQWSDKTDPAAPLVREDDVFSAEGWTNTVAVENVCDKVLDFLKTEFSSAF